MIVLKYVFCFYCLICSFSFISGINANICKKCHCLEENDDLLIVTCKGTTKKMSNIDFEFLEWPKTDFRFIKANFIQMNLKTLPK